MTQVGFPSINREFSMEEKITISNVFIDKNILDEERDLDIIFKKISQINMSKTKYDIRTKDENIKITKICNILNKDQIDKFENISNIDDNIIQNNNFNQNSITNNNHSTNFLKECNEDRFKDYINNNDNKIYLNNSNMLNSKNLYIKDQGYFLNNQMKINIKIEDKQQIKDFNKKKSIKRVKFKENFLDIIEIESYRRFNTNMCYSDLEFVEISQRKSLCRELCNIF